VSSACLSAGNFLLFVKIPGVIDRANFSDKLKAWALRAASQTKFSQRIDEPNCKAFPLGSSIRWRQKSLDFFLKFGSQRLTVLLPFRRHPFCFEHLAWVQKKMPQARAWGTAWRGGRQGRHDILH
jgi:hypothetical protein